MVLCLPVAAAAAKASASEGGGVRGSAEQQQAHRASGTGACRALHAGSGRRCTAAALPILSANQPEVHTLIVRPAK